ncbi:hypothetical protein BH11MYX2_BH11MYX2_12740 [soil metagenome]
MIPRITKVVPAPLVAIVVLTTVTVLAGVHTRTVGDMGQLPTSLPFPHLPRVPFTLATLRIFAPFAASHEEPGAERVTFGVTVGTS